MNATTQTKWNIDPAHSQVNFRIKHLGIANVNGTFDHFSGYAETDNDDFNNATVYFEIDADSINTKHADRDAHLKSPHLFNAAQYPKITFEGSLHKKGDDYELTGELTIGETKKPILLAASFTGSVQGLRNDTRAGFELDGKINRKDYGLTWNILTEAGSLVVGEDVKLQFDIELIKQAE